MARLSHYPDSYYQDVSMSGDAETSGRGARRWLVLAAGTVAVTAGSAFQYGLAYLIPALRADGLSLAQAGLIVACPTVGLLLTLVAWGAAADRWGERLILTTGLTLAGLVLLAGTQARGPAALGGCLVAAGAAGAAVYAASGRLILGWFAAHERGLAMGIRQSSQPLGVAVAALALPSLAARGLASALIFLGGFCLAAALMVAAVVRDPARAGGQALTQRGSPYRTPVLWRIHAASALLVVPQFTVSTFALVFLVDTRGWRAPAAGALLAAAAAAGAASRLGAGHWSDRLASRMRPMRILALATTAVLIALALAAAFAPALAVPILLAAAVLVVSTNGLAFTAVAEYAGPAWAGRALGIQNTGQNALAALTPPVLAVLIGVAGYPVAFAAAGALPLAAAALVPLTAERRAGPGTGGSVLLRPPIRGRRRRQQGGRVLPGQPVQHRRPEIIPGGGLHPQPGPAPPGGVEREPPGVQQGAAGTRRAEERVCLDRVADPGQVDPDLVAAAGDRVNREQGVARVLPEGGERGEGRIGPHVTEDRAARDRPPAAGGIGGDAGPRGGHPGPALAAGAERQVDDALRRQAARPGDGQVGLAHRAAGELAGQRAVPAQLLREQDGAGCHLVDPVHGEQLLARGGGHPDQVGLVPLTHDGDAGRLVQHQHGLVLEDQAGAPDVSPLAHPGDSRPSFRPAPARAQSAVRDR